MAICKGIWGKWPTIAALSTSVQVNGDGRTAAQRHGAPFEPGAHGSTCTLGPDDFAPIAFYNYLGNRGAN